MAYDFPYRGLTSNPAPLTYSMPTGMSSASSRFNPPESSKVLPSSGAKARASLPSPAESSWSSTGEKEIHSRFSTLLAPRSAFTRCVHFPA